MISKSLAGIAGSCLVAGVLGVSGCSHDTLQSSTVGLTLQYTPSPTGAGRYEKGTFAITAVRLLPADPVRRGLLTGSNLSLNATMHVDLTSTATRSFSQVALSPGLYNVVELTIETPVLTDNDPPGAPPCINGIAVVPSGTASVPFSIDLSEADGYTVDVQPGKSTIDFRVDVPGLIAGFEGAFTCQASCNGGGPCLTSFDTNAFVAALRNTLTIQ